MARDSTLFQEAMKRGSAHAWVGRWASAVEEFRQALEQFPEDVSARTQLAMALFRSGQLLEALGLYEGLWKAQPGNLAILARVAELQESLGDGESAAVNYRLLAEIHGRRRSMAEALKAWRKVVELKPDSVLFWGSLMEVAFQLGEAGAMMPGYLRLSRNLALSGRFEEALQVAERARVLDPGNPAVPSLLAALRRALEYSWRAAAQGEEVAPEELARLIPPVELADEKRVELEPASSAARGEEKAASERGAVGGVPATERRSSTQHTWTPRWPGDRRSRVVIGLPGTPPRRGTDPATKASDTVSSPPTPAPPQGPVLWPEMSEPESSEVVEPTPAATESPRVVWPMMESAALDDPETGSTTEAGPVASETETEEVPETEPTLPAVEFADVGETMPAAAVEAGFAEAEAVEPAEAAEAGPGEAMDVAQPQVEAAESLKGLPVPVPMVEIGTPPTEPIDTMVGTTTASPEVVEMAHETEAADEAEESEVAEGEVAEVATPVAEPVVAEDEVAPGPDWAEWLGQARVARAEGRLAEAAEVIEEMLAGGAPALDPLIELTEVYEGLGEKAKALVACNRALEMAPDQPRALLSMARFNISDGRWEGAEENARRAIEKAAIAGNGVLAAGVELLLDILEERASRGEFDAAFEGLTWATATVDISALPATTAYRLSTAPGELLGQCASEHMEEVGQLPPAVRAPVLQRLRRAEEQVRRGYPRSAADEVHGIVAAHPGFLPAQSLLGRTLVGLGRIEEAGQRSRRLLRLYELRGTGDHALEVLLWTVAQGVGNDEARARLVRLLRTQGRLDEADLVERGWSEPRLEAVEPPLIEWVRPQREDVATRASEATEAEECILLQRRPGEPAGPTGLALPVDVAVREPVEAGEQRPAETVGCEPASAPQETLAAGLVITAAWESVAPQRAEIQPFQVDAPPAASAVREEMALKTASELGMLVPQAVVGPEDAVLPEMAAETESVIQPEAIEPREGQDVVEEESKRPVSEEKDPDGILDWPQEAPRMEDVSGESHRGDEGGPRLERLAGRESAIVEPHQHRVAPAGLVVTDDEQPPEPAGDAVAAELLLWDDLLSGAETRFGLGDRQGAMEQIRSAVESGEMGNEVIRAALLRIMMVVGRGVEYRDELAGILRKSGLPEELAS